MWSATPVIWTWMDWEVSYEKDGVVSVAPASGTLKSGESAVVTVSADTTAIDANLLSVANYSLYTSKIKFINKFNESDGGGTGGLTDFFHRLFDGSASRSVRLLIVPPSLAAPVMAQPRMAENTEGQTIPSVVNLSWSYPDPQTKNYVKGYVLYQTTPDPNDPDNLEAWHKAADITNPDKTAYQIAELLPDTTYHFSVMAYGSSVTPGTSEMVSVRTPGVSDFESVDADKPIGRISDISSSCTAGDTVSYTARGWDSGGLSELRFTVVNDDETEIYNKVWDVSGTSAAESHSFPTSGWSPGIHHYALWVKNAAGNSEQYTGFLEIADISESDDTTPPAASVSGTSGSYTAGDTVSCTLEGTDNEELSRLHFTVVNNAGSAEMHDMEWNVSGTSATESHSFPTSGWSPGVYHYLKVSRNFLFALQSVFK